MNTNTSSRLSGHTSIPKQEQKPGTSSTKLQATATNKEKNPVKKKREYLNSPPRNNIAGQIKSVTPQNQNIRTRDRGKSDVLTIESLGMSQSNEMKGLSSSCIISRSKAELDSKKMKISFDNSKSGDRYPLDLSKIQRQKHTESFSQDVAKEHFQAKHHKQNSNKKS